MDFFPKYFNPHKAADLKIHENGVVSVGKGDAPGDVYVYTQPTILAINIAFAANRPLLVTGEPGSGKTTLAQNAARVLGWWFYRETVTSRLQATDLFYTFDALRRLNDANTPKITLPPTEHYVEPGILWWAFDPASAPYRGRQAPDLKERAVNPGIPPSATGPSAGGPDRPDAVVVLDEIDKADPDVPNDLLEAFDARRFVVRETGAVIQADGDRRVLLLLTSNGERELPPAFLRRCVTLALEPPTPSFFVTVANRRYGPEGERLHKAVAEEVMKAREEAQRRGARMPSTAEYLDAVRVCRELDVSAAASQTWQAITGSVLLKSDRT